MSGFYWNLFQKTWQKKNQYTFNGVNVKKQQQQQQQKNISFANVFAGFCMARRRNSFVEIEYKNKGYQKEMCVEGVINSFYLNKIQNII